MIEEWDLSQTNLRRIALRKYEVAVLPIGSTEAHGYHLPEGQDTLQVDYVAKRSSRQAWERCQSVICLPPVPYGSDCNLIDFPLTIDVKQSTLDLVVRDVVSSLVKHGIRKVLIINGHGGNNFMPLVRQLQCDTGSHIFLCDWWKSFLDHYNEIFQKPDDHSGEVETSVALSVHPELVEMDHLGSGKMRPFRFEALEKGWVLTSRRFARINDHCAVGDPTGATAEKGKLCMDIVCQRISDFIVDLAKTPIDDSFPHIK